MPIGVYKHHPQQGFQKGHKCFSNNLKHLSEESILKRNSSWKKMKGKHYSSETEFKKGHPAPKTAFKKGHITWNKGRMGELAWAWQGGKSFESYPIGWNKTFKEQVRYRDGYRCQLCGVPEMECNRKLDIHHIDYNKKNINPSNLITLCRGCHNKTMFNRNFWTDFFHKEEVENEVLYA